MSRFDHDYVNEIIKRLNSLAADARPEWGAMTAPEMVDHLASFVRYSMGRGPQYPDQGSWFSRYILSWLLLRGIIRIPKNLQAPKPLSPPRKTSLCDVETFHGLLEEYLSLVQAGELEPPPHPFFGAIGVDGWARMHVLHFEHHMRQFGV